MKSKLTLLAAASLLTLSACGVYQDYPNDETAIKDNDYRRGAYTGQTHYTGTHPYARHNAYVVDNTRGDVVVGQDDESYMRQNEDKWMYNSCPPGAAKRGDC